MALPLAAFMTFLKNNDQIANSDSRRRCDVLAHPAQVRALTRLMLLMPGTPMLFHGQNSGCRRLSITSPTTLTNSRGSWRTAGSLSWHSSGPGSRARAPRQAARSARRRNLRTLPPRLAWSELHAPILALHRDLLALRGQDPVFSSQAPAGLYGAALGPALFVLRDFGGLDGDRLIVVDLGADVRARSFPKTLIAPPDGATRTALWSSEGPDCGGHGTPPLQTEAGSCILAHATVVLTSRMDAPSHPASSA